MKGFANVDQAGFMFFLLFSISYIDCVFLDLFKRSVNLFLLPPCFCPSRELVTSPEVYPTKDITVKLQQTLSVTFPCCLIQIRCQAACRPFGNTSKRICEAQCGATSITKNCLDGQRPWLAVRSSVYLVIRRVMKGLHHLSKHFALVCLFQMRWLHETFLLLLCDQVRMFEGTLG